MSQQALKVHFRRSDGLPGCNARGAKWGPAPKPENISDDPHRTTCRSCRTTPQFLVALASQPKETTVPKLEALSLKECQEALGTMVKTGTGTTPRDQHLLLSTLEHLKDAARWQWVKSHDFDDLVPGPWTPAEFEKWVDEQLEKKT